MNKYLLTIVVIIMPYTSLAKEQISNFIIPVSYFVNHVKQLSAVTNNLTKYKKASIIGVSGMGKTQLARMYAYENKDNYKLIWFIDCNLDINEEFLKLAKLINKKTKTNLILEDISSAKKEVLSYLARKDKWLLVFDNLKVKENHKVQEFTNWENNGHIIFGSQDGEMLPNIVKMAAFERSDAITLANNILENSDLKSAEFLSQEFGGYPILIVQGAQLLNQISGLDKEEYKRQIGQSTDKIKLNITLSLQELKPSAGNLLNKIALINNQAFSKDLLRIITIDQRNLDDDIYQLSKFALIANIDPSEDNPIFEMHDVIAQKVVEINSHSDNKNYLEEIVVKLINMAPKNLVEGCIFRHQRTMLENLEIIERNASNNNINIYKLLELNTILMDQYVNSLDHYNAEKKVNWFNKNDQQGQFKLWLMNNDEKYFYARYLGSIGAYYKNRFANLYEGFKYYSRAKEVLNQLTGYEASKCSAVYNLAGFYVALGKITEAQNEINEIEQMSKVRGGDIKEIDNMLNLMKAKLYHNNGNEEKALEEIDKNIIRTSKSGISIKDIFFSKCYMLKAEILNSLKKYQEAYDQVKQVYNMHISSKKDTHLVFGQIFAQMSRAQLGLGHAEEALEYARKAKNIFINDPNRPNNSREITVSPDVDLAKAFVAEADALAALGQNEKAAKSYLDAENFYWNNYRENMKNVDEVSRMYLSAAKASCHLKEKAWYIKFHDQHIKTFGADHPRSIEILNMDAKCYP